MTDEQWQQAWEIYRTARDLPDDQRSSYLSSVSSDPEVFEQVILLIHEPADPPPLASDLKPGIRIGRYEVAGKLGRGGMGQVYSARDTELGRELALKLLAPELIASRRAMERLVREARAASALNHPHIVTVYEVVHSGEDVAIAMELVEGEPLRQYCGRPQPVSLAIHWGRQVAQALTAAHARNIVHRDIKPENLMVRPDNYIKVLDFGLARGLAAADESHYNQGHYSLDPAVSNLSKSNPSAMLAGTLNYMSPEQTRAEPATSASDVFSLGIVLYELVTGAHPFLSDSPIDTTHAIAYADAKPPATLNREIPPALNSLILAMLAKNPAARPSAAEVDRRLSAIEAARAKQQSRGFRWLLAAVAACIIAGLVLFWTQERLFSPAGPEMVQLTHQASENRVTVATLSPDGKYLAFAAIGEAVHLRRMRDGFTRLLNTPEQLEINRIAWFSDGSRLLVSAKLNDRSGIWVAAISGREPALIVPDAKDGVPSPNGDRIAFTSLDGSAIWVAGLNGKQSRELVAGEKTTLFYSLVWSPDGKRVAYQRQDTAPAVVRHFERGGDQEFKDYDFRYESTDVSSARVVASVTGIVMNSAAALEDGRILFLRWFDRREEYHRQLWELRTDPSSGRVLGKPRRLTRGRDATLQSLSASRDGREIAAVRFSEQPNVYVADLHSSGAIPTITNLRRLTFSEANEYPHAWTADNAAVFFESNRNGNYQLFRQPVGQGEASTLVDDPGDSWLPQLSPDGKWVLYDWVQPNGDPKLMRVSADGGTPQPVPIAGKLDEFGCALQPGSRCVLRRIENGEFVYYDLDPIRGQGRELARAAWGLPVTHDWDISPDGSQVAIPSHDPRRPAIRIIPLTGGSAPPRERDIVLSGGPRFLNGAVWSPDGKGFFVAFRSNSGFSLEFADAHGQTWPLLKSTVPYPVYAVPSRDGRRVAIPQHTAWSNVWLLHGL